VTTEIEGEFPLNEKIFFCAGDLALSFSDGKVAKNKPVRLYVLRR
jgi:hypothetical protein